MNMKKLTMLLAMIVFLSFCAVYGQNNNLIYPKQVSNLTARTTQILQKSNAYVSVDFVSIDLTMIHSQNQFSIQFGGRNISIKKEKIKDIKGSDLGFGFIGSNDNGCRVWFSVVGDNIQGAIETVDVFFAIKTVDKNEYAIIKVDQSKLEDGCESIQGRINRAVVGTGESHLD